MKSNEIIMGLMTNGKVIRPAIGIYGVPSISKGNYAAHGSLCIRSCKWKWSRCRWNYA